MGQMQCLIPVLGLSFKDSLVMVIIRVKDFHGPSGECLSILSPIFISNKLKYEFKCISQNIKDGVQSPGTASCY